MTTPAIGAIREKFPRAEITLLANPLVAELFSPHAWVDQVMTFDRAGRHRGIAGRFRLAAELRKQAFDAAIILPNSFDSALVPWLAGIPVRLGKGSDGRSLLLTGRYTPDERTFGIHEVQYYLDLIRYFDITGQAHEPQLTLTPDEQCRATLRLTQAGIKPGDILLAIEGKIVPDTSDMFNRIALLAPGTKTKMTVLRKEGEKIVDVVIAKRPKIKKDQ